MNDGLPSTLAHTNASATAFLELDLGVAKETDCVRVVNVPSGGVMCLRLNNVTLHVMDADRTVIFEHTFYGIDQNSPRVFDFDITRPPTVRYLRLERTTPGYLHVSQLEAHRFGHKTIYLHHKEYIV
jgi:hypothetical protein